MNKAIKHPYMLRSVLHRIFITMLAVGLVAFSLPKAFAEAPGKDLIKTKLALKASKIDARIGELKLIARMTAQDPFILDWVERGAPKSDEQLLLTKLQGFVDSNSLTSASFADKASNKYWNHEGFLRVLNPEQDSWYTRYVKSEKQDLISVYHDQNKKRIDLYVNYQDLDGRGLSGIATSFDSILSLMTEGLANAKHLEQTEHSETIYLVDQDGLIQIAPHDIAIQGINVSQHFNGEVSLDPQNASEVAYKTYDDGGYYAYTLLPEMQWFLLVVADKKS